MDRVDAYHVRLPDLQIVGNLEFADEQTTDKL